MSWFDIKQIFPGVVAFMEPGHYEEAISYLIVGSEQAALLDTGMAIGDLQAEVQQVTQLPVRVVNTHAHWDHRGENYKFTDIAIHESEAAALEVLHGADKLAVKTRPGLFTRPTPPGFWPSQWQVFPSKATQLLHDGDQIPLGGRTLEIIHTPGHTPGSIAVLDRAQRWLMTSDTYYPGHIYTFFPYSNWSDYVASVRRLASLRTLYDWVLPSHNQTPMPATEIDALQTAIDGIEADTIAWAEMDTEWGKVKRYDFGTFKILRPL